MKPHGKFGDGLKFLEFLGAAVLRHEVNLAPELVLINVVDPEEDVDEHDTSHPCQLQR